MLKITPESQTGTLEPSPQEGSSKAIILHVYNFAKFHFHLSVFPQNTGLGTDIFIKLEYIERSLPVVKIKSIPDWHLFISGIETKWT